MRKTLHAYAVAAVLLASVTAAAQDGSPEGRAIYEQRCRTCHGTTAPADLPIGPELTGIVGTRAGSQSSGVHSRDAIDSGIVWDRESLRGFLSVPRRVLPGTLMADGIEDAQQLERLLDFLETLQ